MTVSELRKLVIEWSTIIGVYDPASDAFHKRDQALALLDNLNQAAIAFARERATSGTQGKAMR